MKINLYTTGGFSAILYASVTFISYVYLWTRWSIVGKEDVYQILKMINKHPAEWTILWWCITIIPFAILPTFLAILHALWRVEPAISSLAFLAGMTAFILGVIGPLRNVTVTNILAEIYTKGNEMEKVAAVVMFKSGESYGRSLFCVFGAT